MLPENDIQRRAYTYYGSGDIESVTDSLDGVTYNYTYDNLHRLTGETNTGGFDALGYAYDATGNITSKTKGQDIYTYSYNPAHPHAVSKIDLNGTDYDPPYTYDFNGNLISGPDFTDPQQIAARTIDYNTDNMPVHITHDKGGTTVTTGFLYDGLGQRAKKSVINGTTTIPTYYINEYFEVEETTPVKYVFAGNLRVVRATPSGTVYFHKDHLGSSSAMSDATGVAIETSNYMPFGGMRSHAGTWNSDYKFTDQEFDGEAGLYNFNARLYDPVIGRFISADSIVPDPFNPQSLNRYSYCRNNPLIYVDPTGHFDDKGNDSVADGVCSGDVDTADNETGGKAGNRGDDDSRTGVSFCGMKNGIPMYRLTNPKPDPFHGVTTETRTVPGFNGPENNFTGPTGSIKLSNALSVNGGVPPGIALPDELTQQYNKAVTKLFLNTVDILSSLARSLSGLLTSPKEDIEKMLKHTNPFNVTDLEAAELKHAGPYP